MNLAVIAGQSPIVMVLMLAYFAVIILCVASIWATFSKAGQPGWACIVPIYNLVVMLNIAGKPIWWILLLFIPIVGLIVNILVIIAFAEAFGKGVGFALGLVFLPFIFFPILGFGSAEYCGADV